MIKILKTRWNNTLSIRFNILLSESNLSHWNYKILSNIHLFICYYWDSKILYYRLYFYRICNYWSCSFFNWRTWNYYLFMNNILYNSSLWRLRNNYWLLYNTFYILSNWRLRNLKWLINDNSFSHSSSSLNRNCFYYGLVKKSIRRSVIEIISKSHKIWLERR